MLRVGLLVLLGAISQSLGDSLRLADSLPEALVVRAAPTATTTIWDWMFRAAALGTVLALWLALTTVAVQIRAARRRLLDHLEAHLAIIRRWALGPNGHGWTEQDCTLTLYFAWSDPRQGLLVLASLSALTPTTLSDAVFIRRVELKRAIAALAQAIAGLNDYAATIRQLTTGNPLLSASLALKLEPLFRDGNIETRFKSIEDIYKAAGLTADEKNLASLLVAMNRGMRLTTIGSETGAGVYRYMRELEAELVLEPRGRFSWRRSRPASREPGRRPGGANP